MIKPLIRLTFLRLNVYYLMLTKLQEFAARGQIDLSAGLNESQSAAQAEIGEAIQNFDIVKKGALITRESHPSSLSADVLTKRTWSYRRKTIDKSSDIQYLFS